MVSVRQRYEGVLEWLARPDVLCLRFEDLLEKRDSTLDRMLDEVEKTGYQFPPPGRKPSRPWRNSIQPSRSRTFRSGKTGGWREHFTAEHKRLFLDVAGDLLVQLGYERNNDW